MKSKYEEILVNGKRYLKHFILQLEDLRKKMEDADTFLDILSVIS